MSFGDQGRHENGMWRETVLIFWGQLSTKTEVGLRGCRKRRDESARGLRFWDNGE